MIKVSKKDSVMRGFVTSILFPLKLLLVVVFFAACSGLTPTGSDPAGGGVGGGVGETSPAIQDSSTGNLASPEMETGVVSPQVDYDNDVLAKVTCVGQKSVVVEMPLVEDAEYRTFAVFKVYLGLPTQTWLPCCNDRVVRLVDLVTNRFVDYQTQELEGQTGGFQAEVEFKEVLKLKMFLAPIEFKTSELQVLQGCGERCVPEAWHELTSAWDDPSCTYLKPLGPVEHLPLNSASEVQEGSLGPISPSAEQ